MPHRYAPPKRIFKKPKLNDRTLAISVTFFLICILALIIPLGAIVPQRHVRKLPINILVPLYMSPAAGGWDLLYSAIIKHDELDFTVIVSPYNGPGYSLYPAGEYVEAIKVLKAFTNVQILGYVNTDGGNRDNKTVRQEVETYAGWNTTAGLAMHGIFFDQTPFEDSPQARRYLKNISTTVKRSKGIKWPRTVIHNPGVVPNANLTISQVDITVVFEGVYGKVESRGAMKRRLAKIPGDRSNYGVLVHSAPADISRGGLRRLINNVRQNVHIAEHPTLEFIVILNPNSGPGAPPWWPNADYVREIPKLNAQHNVQTLGYVATNYCQRPMADVLGDVATYAGWSKSFETSGLGVQGIFFDETPNLFSEQVKIYLDTITKLVKDSHGLLGNRTVVHNPGTAVDSRLAAPGPDVTTVVEMSHASFQTPEHQQWLETSPYDRTRSCYMVHSVPAEEVEEFAYGLRGRAKYLFVTDLDVGYYQSFGKSWNLFVEALTRS
ncbi:hypothetical protein K505DRAFT_285346 [Melanomma pulvis-pyrius CBS 109.77]|uniref:Uncharacterized protein n=1 Tax=Melanomma pulvis-pyrius CBS 109.77 TaxID=1314802 RepID=A0A6A6WXQ6_9PLEO|nr:hypothetical protein K505DRAFT_285346 [Melanomma pulvis-pyrius CBS 109.77]